MSARVLVTGATGFIGRHLVERLRREGHDVWALSRIPASDAGQVHAVQADLRDPQALVGLTTPMDAIFHLAGLTSPQQTLDDSEAAMLVNGLGTLRVLACARRMGTPSIILASSVYIYDGCTEFPWHETLPVQPRSPLGASKLAAEAAARMFWYCYQAPSVVLRLFTVYGPGARASQFVPSALQRIIDSPGPQVRFGPGESTRDFVYIEDVITALMQAWSFSAGRKGFEAMNIASGVETRIDEIVQMMLKVCGRPKLQPRFEQTRSRLDERYGPTRHWASIEQARQRLGWSPTISLEVGLRRTVDALRNAQAVGHPAHVVEVR